MGKEAAETKPKPAFEPAYIRPQEYAASAQGNMVAAAMDPICTVPHAHLIGISKTPLRIYRFLNRRHTAREVSERAVDVVLAQRARWWDEETDKYALVAEEPEWPKRYWKREDAAEREWTADMALDPRVTAALRFFEHVEPDDAGSE